MKEENEYDKPIFPLRKILLRLALIIAIIILVAWLVPKFFTNKDTVSKTVKSKNTTETVKIESNNMQKLESVGLKYFNKENISSSEGKKITLNELIENKLVQEIKNNGKTCDVKKSYVKLTKTNDAYLLKTSLTCGKTTDYKLLNVGEYSYCTNSLLCEKNETILENKNKEEKKNDTPKDEQKDSTIKEDETKQKTPTLSQFSKWENYTKTSCDTQAITCDINDTTCLKEVKLYKRTEIVGTKLTNYKTEHTALRAVNTTTKNVCSSYNYLVINNVIFRTKGNYGEILNLNKQTTTNWTYNGQISIKTSPRFGANEYYKYVGADSKADTLFYYDSYKYNYQMERVTSYTSDCSDTSNKAVTTYQVYKQQETYTKEDKVYATACYSSTRTRTYN